MPMKQIWRYAIILATGLLMVSCQPVSSQPTATSKAPEVTQAAGTGAPADAKVLKQITADLDGDGKAEEIGVYQAGEQLGVSIAAPGRYATWSTALPKGATLDELSSRDLTGDRNPDVLVATHGSAKDIYELTIVRWAAGKGELVAPRSGPLDGLPYFSSRYYPVAVDDLNDDGQPEVFVAMDATEPHFLDTTVYEWDGKQFVKSELYLMAPRLVPTAKP
jgi:hypothetical protein